MKNKMPNSKRNTKDYSEAPLESLRKQALQLGATAAKIIQADKIIIEERLVLKCSLGCEKYGKTLACPPHAPTPEKFKKIVNEYHHALFMQFKSTAELEPALIKYLAKTPDATVPEEIKGKVERFWSAWKDDLKKLLNTVIELEKAAAKEGYILAAGFVSGSCQICEKCNVEKGICLHPEKRRYSEEGLGVNVKATAEQAGIKFTLPFEKNPETYALLLID
jgi:predicted metal-binding protein